ncbi:unnamed protein product [Amoebophrya sp. A120]|nr:unnamed protein product [Amoebophrya sp. A120]|eukprot:GSA120T00003183001.1
MSSKGKPKANAAGGKTADQDRRDRKLAHQAWEESRGLTPLQQEDVQERHAAWVERTAKKHETKREQGLFETQIETLKAQDRHKNGLRELAEHVREACETTSKRGREDQRANLEKEDKSSDEVGDKFMSIEKERSSAAARAAATKNEGKKDQASPSGPDAAATTAPKKQASAKPKAKARRWLPLECVMKAEAEAAAEPHLLVAEQDVFPPDEPNQQLPARKARLHPRSSHNSPSCSWWSSRAATHSAVQPSDENADASQDHDVAGVLQRSLGYSIPTSEVHDSSASAVHMIDRSDDLHGEQSTLPPKRTSTFPADKQPFLQRSPEGATAAHTRPDYDFLEPSQHVAIPPESDHAPAMTARAQAIAAARMYPLNGANSHKPDEMSLARREAAAYVMRKSLELLIPAVLRHRMEIAADDDLDSESVAASKKIVSHMQHQQGLLIILLKYWAELRPDLFEPVPNQIDVYRVRIPMVRLAQTSGQQEGQPSGLEQDLARHIYHHRPSAAGKRFLTLLGSLRLFIPYFKDDAAGCDYEIAGDGDAQNFSTNELHAKMQCLSENLERFLEADLIESNERALQQGIEKNTDEQHHVEREPASFELESDPGRDRNYSPHSAQELSSVSMAAFSKQAMARFKRQVQDTFLSMDVDELAYAVLGVQHGQGFGSQEWATPPPAGDDVKRSDDYLPATKTEYDVEGDHERTLPFDAGTGSKAAGAEPDSNSNCNSLVIDGPGAMDCSSANPGTSPPSLFDLLMPGNSRGTTPQHLPSIAEEQDEEAGLCSPPSLAAFYSSTTPTTKLDTSLDYLVSVPVEVQINIVLEQERVVVDRNIISRRSEDHKAVAGASPGVLERRQFHVVKTTFPYYTALAEISDWALSSSDESIQQEIHRLDEELDEHVERSETSSKVEFVWLKRRCSKPRKRWVALPADVPRPDQNLGDLTTDLSQTLYFEMDVYV